MSPPVPSTPLREAPNICTQAPRIWLARCMALATFVGEEPWLLGQELMRRAPPTTRRRGSRGGRTTYVGWDRRVRNAPSVFSSQNMLPSLLFVTHRHTNTLMTSYSLLSLSLYLSLQLPARSCSPSSLRSDGDSRAARESIHYYLSMTKVDNKTRACVSCEPVRASAGPGPCMDARGRIVASLARRSHPPSQDGRTE